MLKELKLKTMPLICTAEFSAVFCNSDKKTQKQSIILKQLLVIQILLIY